MPNDELKTAGKVAQLIVQHRMVFRGLDDESLKALRKAVHLLLKLPVESRIRLFNSLGVIVQFGLDPKMRKEVEEAVEAAASQLEENLSCTR